MTLKKTCLLSVCLGLVQNAAAQTTQTISEDGPFSYEIAANIIVFGYDFLNEVPSASNITPPDPQSSAITLPTPAAKIGTQATAATLTLAQLFRKNAREGLGYYLVGGERNHPSIGDYYVIKFFPIVSEPPALAQDPFLVNGTNDHFYYCIKKEEHEGSQVRKRYYMGWRSRKVNVGVLAIPFKIRPRIGDTPADFTGDFTLGSTVGLSIRTSRYNRHYLNFSLAGGLTFVNVDSSTTDGYVSTTAKWSALSPGLAVVYDLSGFQLGIVIGSDFVGGYPGSMWRYNNNLWYSIGVGYQFIKPKTD